MNSKVNERIAELKRLIPKKLRDAQSGQTPQLDSFIYDQQVWRYTYDNQPRLVNPDFEAAFRLRYMYFKTMEPRKYMDYHVSFSSISALIQEEVIDSFLVFINGRMVPWSMIDVILSHENYFILIHTLDPEWLYQLKHVEDFKIMHLPNGFTYIDYPMPKLEATVWGFDYMGNFTDAEENDISIINKSQFIRWNSVESSEQKIIFRAFNNPKIKLFPNNAIVFRNGKLSTEDTEVTVDTTFFSIENPNEDNLKVYVFRDTRASETVDNLSEVGPSYVQESIENGKDETYNQIATEFDKSMDRNKTYADNVDDYLKYCYEYNANLFNGVYKEYAKLNIEEMTGQEFLDTVRIDGYAYIPREHSDFTDEYIIMLQNGELYKYYYACVYTADYYKIPVQGVEPEDSIEIMRFKGINNNRGKITITGDEGYVRYDENYINDDMILFSPIPPADCDFTYPTDGLQHFPVPYHLEYDVDNEGVKIILDDEDYYGKELQVVYNHQFHHYWYKITEGSVGENDFRIDLGTKFMYCNDYTRFLVFLNGHRLSTDQYRLTLPVRSTTPFFRFEIYLTMLVTAGDRLDIIYTPAYMRDVALISEIGEDGVITVPRENLTVPLSIENYMVWANGNKVPGSYLMNIDSTRIKINTDIGTTKTVAVTKYVPDIDELTAAFQDNRALWDTIMSTLTLEEILHILDASGVVITDTQPSIYDGCISVRSVMLELIREKYIINAGVDITKPFTYGYDDVDKPTSITDGYDSAGDAILPAADANLQENIDDIEYPWP